MYVHEAGKHGIGMKIRKGDQVVIPKEWLKLSFDPTKTTGRFTKYGLSWFAGKILVGDLPKKKEEIKAELQRIEDECDSVLTSSKLLRDLDIKNPDHSEKIIDILTTRKDTSEWWAFLIGAFLSIVRDALEKNDIEKGIWAMGCAERFRSMLVFKEHLEEVVWMGHSAKRVIDILRTWDNNRSNSDEGFWQKTFATNSYVLSQVFAVPIVFIKDKAYVGGMNIHRKEAKFIDYLCSLESSREAVLIEIKTPVTKLLGSKYRQIYKPSRELSGAILQLLDYRTEFVKNLERVTEGTQHNISAFNPKCVIIVGNGKTELTEEKKRKSFELFRYNQKDVEIVTYDELFRKIEVLANLFSLIRAKADNQN
jgi:hypothetical protein